MKNVLAACVLGSMLSASAAMAGTQSDMPLGTIIVNPDSQNSVPFTRLQHHIDYNVQCSIRNSNPISKDIFVVGFGTTYVSGANGDFIFNGENVGPAVYDYQRPLIPMQKNTLIAEKMHNFNSALNFTDTSQTQSLRVTCSATVNPTIR